MRVVAFDTSTSTLGVAFTNGQTSWSKEHERVGGVESLLPLLQQGCEEMGWQPYELQGVICGAGPGSFTGLRTSIATAKGLCMALDVPLVLVSSFEAWSLQAQPSSYALVCSYANQTEVYACLYLPREHSAREGGRKITEDLLRPNVWRVDELQAVFPTTISNVEIFGDAPARIPFFQQLGTWQENSHPKALDVLRLGLPRIQRGETEDVERAVPDYLLTPVVEKQNRR